MEEGALDIAALIASAYRDYADEMSGLDPAILAQAGQLLFDASLLAASDPQTALDNYEQATILLIPEMYPDFIPSPGTTGLLAAAGLLALRRRR